MQVGDTVYLKPEGNNLRRGYKETDIEEYKIKKIGRKYIEVWKDERENSTEKFYLNNYRQVTDYSPTWTLHLTKQEILDLNEYNSLLKEIKIRLYFDGWGKINISLEKLREIQCIIKR